MKDEGYKVLNRRYSNVLKMDNKGQTTVLSVIFVLVGMMFLVPVITEKALGRIEASVAFSPAFGEKWLTFVSSHLDDGKFVSEPTKGPTNTAFWTTTGTGIFDGDEKGYVKYDVKEYGIATFYFSNPSSGSNSCKVEAPITLETKCSITQGQLADARYVLIRH